MKISTQAVDLGDLRIIEQRDSRAKKPGRKYSTQQTFKLSETKLLTRLWIDEDAKELLLSLLKDGNQPYAIIHELNASGFITKWKVEEDIGHTRIEFYLMESNQPVLFCVFDEEDKFLVQEDFDTDADWTATPTSPVTSSGYGEQAENVVWTLLSGAWITDATIYVKGAQSLRLGAGGYLSFGSKDWSNYQLSFYLRSSVTTSVFQALFRTNGGTTSTTSTAYIVNFGFNTDTVIFYKDVFANTGLKSVVYTFAIDTWYKIDIYCVGNKISLYMNGVEIFTIIDAAVTAGTLQLYSAHNYCYVDNVIVKELNPHYVFTNQLTNKEYEVVKYSSHGELKGYQGQAKFTPMYDNCVLWLDFNNIKGSIIPDKSKYRNSGTIYGGYEIMGAEHGKGWHLEANDYIEIADADSLDGFSEATWVFRFKSSDTTTTTARMFTKWDTATASWLISHGDAGTSTIRCITNISSYGAAWDIDDTNYANNIWHTLVMVWEKQKLYVYIDSELLVIHVATSTSSLASNSGKVYIGKTNAYSGYIMDVDFAAIYNKAIHPINQNQLGIRQYYYTRNSDADGFWDDLVFKLDANKGYGTTVWNQSKYLDASTTQSADWANADYLKQRKVLDFETSNSDYVKFADQSYYSFNSDIPFSVMSNIKIESITGTNMDIISKFDNSAGNYREWDFYISTDGKIVLRLYDPTSGIYISRRYDTALSITTNYHLIGSYNGEKLSSGIKIYKDGIQVDDTSSDAGNYVGMSNTASTLAIGSIGNPAQYFDGQIDNVAIWRNRELTADQIKWLYQNSPEIRNLSLATKFYSNRIFKHNEAMIVDTGLVQMEFCNGRVLRTWFWDWNNKLWVYSGAPSTYYSLTDWLNRVVSFEIEEMTQFYTRVKCKIENNLTTGTLLSSVGHDLYYTIEFFYGQKGFKISFSGSLATAASDITHVFKFNSQSVPTSDFNADFIGNGTDIWAAELQSGVITSSVTSNYLLAIDEYKNMIVGIYASVFDTPIWYAEAAFDLAQYISVGTGDFESLTVAYDFPSHTIIMNSGFSTGSTTYGTYSEITGATYSKNNATEYSASANSATYSCGTAYGNYPRIYKQHSIKRGEYFVSSKFVASASNGIFFTIGISSDVDKYYCISTLTYNPSSTVTKTFLIYLDEETIDFNLIFQSTYFLGIGSWVDLDLLVVLPITNSKDFILDELKQLMNRKQQEIGI